jgi:hypothetical protein
VSAAPAASLSAALLVTKGNAQLKSGLAQPMAERLGFAMRSIDARDAPDDPSTKPVTWPELPSFVPPPPPPATAFASLTLRVDETQRLRLRLASAHLGKNRQEILIEAIEHYFKHVLPAFLHDPCPCIQGGSAIGGDCCQRSETP